ncbi:hypothetical protein [Noviherbaspirillum malthae]|uniref:hypothetical protein n=1 Tax=Noviherbaspirillum malthae TaxID=1260987 RepID=UPI00188E28A6|nr:hypothetical protein [Noviherbaspirillum malthae]
MSAADTLRSTNDARRQGKVDTVREYEAAAKLIVQHAEMLREIVKAQLVATDPIGYQDALPEARHVAARRFVVQQTTLHRK